MITVERITANLIITDTFSNINVSKVNIIFDREQTKSSLTKDETRILYNKEDLIATLVITKPIAEVSVG